MKYPRILVISHNCFSESGSNGRTLANFFSGYPTDNIAQFYIYNELPDTDVCKSYYRVTDGDALKSILSSHYGSAVEPKQPVQIQGDNAVSAAKMPKRTPFVYYVRELIWKFGHWYNENLKKWIDDFNPEVVLFQAGDAAFLFEFAMKIAEKRNIPFVIYNSESYYFKEKNYLADSLLSNFWYRIQHHYFKKYAGRAIEAATHSIYISDDLRNEYDKKFGRPSSTIMTSTALLGTPEMDKAKNLKLSYLGNLQVGRYETLIELAGIVQNINKDYTIDVYGRATEEIEQLFNETSGINYCGFVSYDECINIMKSSTILVHIENFSDFYLMDSKYAFSTKIADSLACQTCLFVYAPKELSCSKYLLDNDCACVASDKQDAYEKLKELINDANIRDKYAKKGMEIAKQNHSLERNRRQFQDILCQMKSSEE